MPHIKTNINLPMLFRVMGWLMMIEAVFMLLPLVTCLIYHESDYMAFVISVIITFGAGVLMTSCIRPRHNDMNRRDGFLLTAMVWVVFSIFGMIPFLTCTEQITLTDAFFETMSGFTTTGASILPSVSSMSHGILAWRCLMQWIGGMGIILFTLAVLPMLNYSGGIQLFNAEVTGITHDKLRPRISQTAKGLWMVYISLTVVLILLLWAGPMDFFDSMCHAFSTVSTGGFSTRPGSIGDWHSSYVDILLIVFMFLGGVNFSLIFKAATTGNVKEFWRNEVFRAYVFIILATYLMFAISIFARGQATSAKSVVIDPLFQIVSTLTSTGHSVCNFENWGGFVLLLTFILMVFGGCAGSTGGGAKIDRILYLFKNTTNELYRSIRPNVIRAVKMNGKVLPEMLANKVTAFICLYLFLIFVGGCVLTASGIPFTDAMFSAFSCVGNTGLGAGVTGAGGSFGVIPAFGKWVMSLLMLIGRLELFTILLLFTPGFWHK